MMRITLLGVCAAAALAIDTAVNAAAAAVFFGKEDTITELRLPTGCASMSWEGTTLDGLVTSVDGLPITSGNAFPAAAGCTLLFSPPADLFGDLPFSYTLASDTHPGVRHNARLVVVPARDPPAAIADAATVDAGSHVYIPVLANDVDVDVGSSLCQLTHPDKDVVRVRVVQPDNAARISIQIGSESHLCSAGASCQLDAKLEGACTNATVVVEVDAVVYRVQQAMAGHTVVIRPSGSPQDMHAHSSLYLAPCKLLRVLSVSDPLHGHAVAVAELEGAPGTSSPTAHLRLTNDDYTLPVAIVYYPDPGYEGADSFTYEVGDGFPGQGSASTGTVNVEVRHGKVTQLCEDQQSWKCVIQTYDGRFNCLAAPESGSMMTPLRRLLPAAYADGIEEPSGASRPSTRLISNELFEQPLPITAELGVSELSVHFGQFLTHDIDFSTPLADYKAEANFVIPIPKGDPWFDPDNTGNTTMRFRRSGPQLGTGAGSDIPRQQLNKITSFLDLNVIYGTLNGRNKALRTNAGGKLLHMQGSGLPPADAVAAAAVQSSGQGSPSGTSSASVDASGVMSGGAGSHTPAHFGSHMAPAAMAPRFGQDVECINIQGESICKPRRLWVEHLSLNNAHLPNLNLLGKARDSLFVSGDNRANVQPGLVAMHTLLAREHNTAADELQAALLSHTLLSRNPSAVVEESSAIWRALHPAAPSFHTPSVPAFHKPHLLHIPGISTSVAHLPYPVPVSWPHAFDGSSAALKHYDELLFQTARALTRAKWQAVVWYEWLPIMLGQEQYAQIPPYAGYQADVDPSAINEFATAAFRFGHSQVGPTMRRLNSSTGCSTRAGPISLRDAYFTATRLLGEGGVDPILAGSVLGVAQEVDTKAVSEIRNLLFGTHTQGFDLIALNIQRGRDHGIPDYNTVREELLGNRARSWQHISSNPQVAETLSQLYSSVDDLDFVVGGLAEDHVPGGAVGPTFAALIRMQFQAIRDADRFWFENTQGPQEELLRAVGGLQALQNTRIADILARNSVILDGRLGAEVVWTQATDLTAGTAAPSGWVRKKRDGLQPVLVDSLFFARPTVQQLLLEECHEQDSNSGLNAFKQPDDDAIDSAYG